MSHQPLQETFLPVLAPGALQRRRAPRRARRPGSPHSSPSAERPRGGSSAGTDPVGADDLRQPAAVGGEHRHARRERVEHRVRARLLPARRREHDCRPGAQPGQLLRRTRARRSGPRPRGPASARSRASSGPSPAITSGTDAAARPRSPYRSPSPPPAARWPARRSPRRARERGAKPSASTKFASTHGLACGQTERAQPVRGSPHSPPRAGRRARAAAAAGGRARRRRPPPRAPSPRQRSRRPGSVLAPRQRKQRSPSR